MQQTAEKDVYGNTWESEVSDDGEFVRHQTSRIPTSTPLGSFRMDRC